MLERVFETEKWVVEYDEEKDTVRITRFKDGHWNGDIHLDSNTFNEVETFLDKGNKY